MSSGSVFALGRKAERRAAGAADAAAAIDERIEHQAEELLVSWKAPCCAAGRGFAGELARAHCRDWRR